MSRSVLVTGMHRSGTSAATRLINLLGVPVCPDGDLIKAGPGNEAGYWESSTLTGLNEELLAHMGGAWWRPPVLTTGRLAAAVAGHGERALGCFRRSHPAGPWVWKDPRNCILLPFWRRVLGQDPVVVLALRNLHDVCRSLETRNGFSAAWSLAMCERYLGHALRALNGLPVVVTHYEQLVDDPQSWIESTASALGDLGVRVTGPPAGEVAAFVRSGLRHSRHEDEDMRDLPLTPAQRALVDTAFGLRGPYPSFPALVVPAESASTTTALESPAGPAFAQPEPQAPVSVPVLAPAPARRGAARAGTAAVTIVADVGSDGALSRRALATCVATAPEGSVVLLAGPRTRELEADLRRISDDVTVIGCDPADLVGVIDEAGRSASGYVVFTSDLAHPHPLWAQALTGAFADARVGAAGPLLRAWHRPGWSTPGLRIGDAALNGVWLEAGPDDLHDVPLLCRHFMAVRRSVLAEVGGLDAAMTRDGVWDWELCARIWRAGHRIVAVPGASVTVRFADAGPTSLPAFRRNLLRFAALHLAAEPLAQLMAGLDVRHDPGLVLDVLASEAPARRRWLHTSLSASSDACTRHLLTACGHATAAREVTPRA